MWRNDKIGQGFEQVHSQVRVSQEIYLGINRQPEIDNNRTDEDAYLLREKELLFCGSEQAAKNTSLIYSIIESCKMSGLRPVKYIAYVLRKLVSDDTELYGTSANEYCKIT